jgi:N-acetylmuramoyl-L-alanine amidase
MSTLEGLTVFSIDQVDVDLKSRTMETVKEIILHHSATPARSSMEIETIMRYLQSKGGSLGYHYIVSPDGMIIQTTPPDRIVSHCTGHNSVSIGVELMGDFSKTAPPTIQADKATLLCRALRRKYPTITSVLGHRDAGAKTACPGDSFPLEQMKAAILDK